MIVDANLLLYAVDDTSPQHERARDWWEVQLSGSRRVGLPWQSIGAFLRLVTHPRVFRDPLTSAAAWAHVTDWLDAAPVWVPPTTERTVRVLGDVLARTDVTANLVPDAQLAALAVEHGVPVASADGDFARFESVTWINPLR